MKVKRQTWEGLINLSAACAIWFCVKRADFASAAFIIYLNVFFLLTEIKDGVNRTP